MARTEAELQKESPVKHYISFNGKDGKFGIRKEDGDWQNIDTLTFVVLDMDCHGIRGKKSLAKDAPRFSSNMASRTYPQLIVKFDGKEIARGKWGEIKPKSKEDTSAPTYKADYNQYIFALADVGFGKELVRIALKGKALAAWMNFCKKDGCNPMKDIAVKFTGVELTGSNDGLESYVPVFEPKAVSEATIAEANKICDEVFIPWRDAYFKVDLNSTTGSPNIAADQPASDEKFPDKEPVTTQTNQDDKAAEQQAPDDSLPF